jgi:tyrosine-protein kinase Etk/Wzc
LAIETQSAAPILPVVLNSPVWDGPDSSGPPIALLPLLRSYLRRWPLILLMMFAGGGLLYAASYLVKPTFQAHALFLPPAQQHSAADLTLGALISSSSPAALYPGLVGSESVQDDVIQALDLQKAYRAQDLEAARRTLKSVTSIEAQPGGFYELAVTDPQPARARDIANAYLAALLHINSRLSLEEAAQQRAIYQQVLDHERGGLDDAEAALAAQQKSTGVVSAQQQTTAGLTQIDELRSEITLLRANLAALLQGETEQAPDVVRDRSQLAQYESQLASMEGGQGGGAGGGLSAARAPDANLQFMRLQRDVEAHRAVYDLATRQYEGVQLQAQTSSPNVEIVDFPQLPLHKAFPRRSFYAAAGLALGLFFAVVMIFVGDRMRYVRQDAERLREWEEISAALRHPVLNL